MPRAEVAARLLDHRHEGSRSQFALGILAPLIERTEKRIIAAAKERYRAGHRDAQEALLIVAQLVAISDLRDELEHAVKRGNRAADRLINDVP